MTREQAKAELKRLCQALDRQPETLQAHQTAAWLEMLEELPYETGRLAVTRVYQTWRSNRFPPPGALTAAVEEIRQDGIPAAGAYSQDPPRGTAGLTPEQLRKAIEQQDRWIAMSDEEYLEELERIRERQERRAQLRVVRS